MNHNLFTPKVVVEDSLNEAMRLNRPRDDTSYLENSLVLDFPKIKEAHSETLKSDESLEFDDIESILGPDSDEEFTSSKINCYNSLDDHDKQPDCDNYETSVSNKNKVENFQDDSYEEHSHEVQGILKWKNRQHFLNDDINKNKQSFSSQKEQHVFVDRNKPHASNDDDNEMLDNEVNGLDDDNLENKLCSSNDDDVVCISLSSSDSEEESEEYSNLNTANNHQLSNILLSADAEGLKQYESDPRFNCNLLLRDFVADNMLNHLEMKYNIRFSENNGKKKSNGCETDSQSSTGGSCIVLSSSSDESDDDNEILPADFDEYSDEDDCYIVEEEECNDEINLPHTFPNILIDNDIIEIDD